ncbi:MAG: leucine-rich repeat protein [Oscillibacter sp.]|nr:leucine-rich repeat protein [Oscillibacter sp.]
MKKKLFVPLLILAALIGLLTAPATAATVLASGECGAQGNAVTWTLDRDGLLTVSGTGAMYDYSNAEDVPWYAYREQVKSVSIQSGVTTVGKNAFQSCANLTAVTFPAKGLISIGDVAFYQCDTLATVTIPEGVTDIGENAFGFCALSTFAIPASVTNIGESAFYQCAALTAITVNENNTSYSAVDGILFNHDKSVLIWYPAKKSLTEYNVPETVKRIGSYAFHNSSLLKKVTIPSVANGGLVEIGPYAFAYGALSEITIPVSMTTVGDYAFRGCAGLSDDSGKAVGTVNYTGSRQQWSALIMGTGNYRLTNSNIVFGDMKQDNVIASGECGAVGNNASWSLSKEGEFLISGKGVMKDYQSASAVPWSAYGTDATDLRPQILTVTVSNGISNVGDYAFYDCEKLKEVKLPESVTSIGSRTFSNCAALTDINLSETLITSIGNYAFNGCAALAGVTFPETLLTIGGRAFLNCSGLTEITLPSAVTSVGEWAFRGCTKLASFTMAPLAKEESAHYTSIDAYALADCAALQNVSFTENLTVLGDYALTKCEKLAAVTLPASVSGVGNCAFSSCPALAAVNVDENNQTYCALNSMLMNKDQTYILYYPGGRNSAACAIPDSVTSIASFAFQGATALKDIYYAGSQTQWNQDVLPNIGQQGNDPLLSIMNDKEHFHCEGTDTSDPANVTSITSVQEEKTETGTNILVSVHCGANVLGATALCAMYDKDGCFLTVDSRELATPGTDYDLTFSVVEDTAELRLFVLDGENLPRCSRTPYTLTE